MSGQGLWDWMKSSGKGGGVAHPLPHCVAPRVACKKGTTALQATAGRGAEPGLNSKFAFGTIGSGARRAPLKQQPLGQYDT